MWVLCPTELTELWSMHVWEQLSVPLVLVLIPSWSTALSPWWISILPSELCVSKTLLPSTPRSHRRATSPRYTFSCSGWTHKRNWPLLYVQCHFYHLCWCQGLVAAEPVPCPLQGLCANTHRGTAGSPPASPTSTSLCTLFSLSLADKQGWWQNSCNSGKQDIWEARKEGADVSSVTTCLYKHPASHRCSESQLCLCC